MKKRLIQRSALRARYHRHLERRGFPRTTMAVILSGAGLVAFLVSSIGLRAGLASMGLRYLLAAAAGYVAFAALIRLWISLQRRSKIPDVDLTDVPDLLQVALDNGNASDTPVDTLGGGRSGGGGASRSWAGGSDGQVASSPGGSSGFSLDLDDFWWVAIAAALAAGGLVAALYVVWIAPALLAEVAFDAALVATAYRRLRYARTEHWMGAVLRRTWAPALILIVFVALAGGAVQMAVPSARSIGDVFRTK